MTTLFFRTRNTILILTIVASALLCGCKKLSETVHNKTAGMNGSFEITESGLPVNWLIYSPKTIPTGDYDLIVDTTEYKDGKQSLKFLVRECSSAGGENSPGLSQEYKAIPGGTYTVSFWVKNNGSEFLVRIGGVSTLKGRYETIVKSKESMNTWRQFECKYTMPPDFGKIRFELNILRPGSFWIDEVRIEGSDGKSAIPTTS